MTEREKMVEKMNERVAVEEEIVEVVEVVEIVEVYEAVVEVVVEVVEVVVEVENEYMRVVEEEVER